VDISLLCSPVTTKKAGTFSLQHRTKGLTFHRPLFLGRVATASGFQGRLFWSLKWLNRGELPPPRLLPPKRASPCCWARMLRAFVAGPLFSRKWVPLESKAFSFSESNASFRTFFVFCGILPPPFVDGPKPPFFFFATRTHRCHFSACPSGLTSQSSPQGGLICAGEDAIWCAPGGSVSALEYGFLQSTLSYDLFALLGLLGRSLRDF